jgi:hypothetical protein
MTTLIGKIGIGLSKEISQEKIDARTNLFSRYVMQNKIVGDFILLDDNTIQIEFATLTDAKAFAQEIELLYANYTDDSVIIEYV